MSREDFEKRMPEVDRLLRQAAVCAEKKTAGMAREILRWEKCLCDELAKIAKDLTTAGTELRKLITKNPEG